MKRKTKLFFNPELMKTESYQELFVVEEVQIHNSSKIEVRHHYWQDASGELWVDFDDPQENIRADFLEYRRVNGFLDPAKIKELRVGLKLSLLQFSQLLGISDGVLAQIESNGRVQEKYEDNLLRWADDNYHDQPEKTFSRLLAEIRDSR